MENLRNKRRQDNYNNLRCAGFSAKEATKYKNYSRKRVAELIEQREAYNKNITAITGTQEARNGC